MRRVLIGAVLALVFNGAAHAQVQILWKNDGNPLTTGVEEFAHPEAGIFIDPAAAQEAMVLGGGARVNNDANGPGNFLFNTSPAPYTATVYRGWNAGAKDHERSDPATITAFLIRFSDPLQGWFETTVVRAEGQISGVLVTGAARAQLPPGWTLTGGGCDVRWRSAPNAMGVMLTGSYPDAQNGWNCEAGGTVENPGTVAAYVIGIRSRNTAVVPQPVSCIAQVTSFTEPRPAAQAGFCKQPADSNDPVVITGGGARVVGPRFTYLTETAPGFSDQWASDRRDIDSPFVNNVARWQARSRAMLFEQPHRVIAYAITVDFAP